MVASREDYREDYAARSRAVWSTGDYAPTSRQLEPAATRLIAHLGVGACHAVLDVAAGDGNGALAAARCGAAVTAADFSALMVDTGRRRSQRGGLEVAWVQADANGLPFVDGAFDRVASVFGMIFAAHPALAAAEAMRVTRRGGAVGLTAWAPAGYAGELFGAVRQYIPSQPGMPDFLDWGRPDRLARLFEPAGGRVEVRERKLVFRCPSWDAWASDSRAHGMAVVARQTLLPERYQAMQRTIEAVTRDHDRGQEGEVVVGADYLEVMVTRS